MKVTLGVIVAGGFPVAGDFLVGYSALQQQLIQSLGADDAARVLFERNFPIDWARNHCAATFLDHDNGDYLLFLDADMIHPPDMVGRLLAHRKDIVTAHYVARRPPHFTVAMQKVGKGPTDYQSVGKLLKEEKGLIPVDAAGAGCLLISRRCLSDMRRMFKERAKARRAALESAITLAATHHKDAEAEVLSSMLGATYPKVEGDNWFQYQDGPDGLRSRSEDMWFFEQAKLAGYQAYLDADIKCQHLAQFAVDYRYHEPYREQYQQAMAAKEARV